MDALANATIGGDTARSWIAHASLDGDGASGIVITAYFLLGGVLFSALGWLVDIGSAPAARPT